MNLGICAKCKNKNELHEGLDGRGYCEDCLEVKQAMPSVEGKSWRAGNPHYKDKKEDYLEFIITNATDEWIEKFLDEWKQEMRRSYAWVTELRNIDDSMKLLRLAAELGYGKVETRREVKASSPGVKAKKTK